MHTPLRSLLCCHPLDHTPHVIPDGGADDALPRPPPSLSHRADLVLAIGTSLRIEPAGSLPQLARSFVIVNLQKTPKDAEAALIVRAPIDMVMREIMREVMGLELRDADGAWVPCGDE